MPVLSAEGKTVNETVCALKESMFSKGEQTLRALVMMNKVLPEHMSVDMCPQEDSSLFGARPKES